MSEKEERELPCDRKIRVGIFARMVSPDQKSRSEVSDVCSHDESADLCPDSGQVGRYVSMGPPL